MGTNLVVGYIGDDLVPTISTFLGFIACLRLVWLILKYLELARFLMLLNFVLNSTWCWRTTNCPGSFFTLVWSIVR